MAGEQELQPRRLEIEITDQLNDMTFNFNREVPPREGAKSSLETGVRTSLSHHRHVYSRPTTVTVAKRLQSQNNRYRSNPLLSNHYKGSEGSRERKESAKFEYLRKGPNSLSLNSRDRFSPVREQSATPKNVCKPEAVSRMRQKIYYERLVKPLNQMKRKQAQLKSTKLDLDPIPTI